MRWVLLALASGQHTTTTIAKHTKKNRGNVCRTLRTLINKGLAEQQKATYQYFLTTFGKDTALKITAPELTTKTSQGVRTDNNHGGVAARRGALRGHRLSVRIPILKPVPREWQRKVREILVKEHVDFSTSDMRHHFMDSFKLDRYTIKTTPSSVLVMLEHVDFRDQQQFWLDATPLVLDAACEVEKRFGVKLDFSQPMSVRQLEVADEGNPLAERSEQNYVVYMDEQDGARRLMVDRSKGVAELEGIHRSLSDEDMQVILSCMVQYADGAMKPKDVEVLLEKGTFELSELRNIVGLWMNSQRAYMENIHTHIATERATQEAVRELAAQSKLQTKVLERLEGRLS